ncbi:MAG: amidohydrolase family protein [Thermomicrobiales bacterium]|nr:amidohydrolase family protein [Thermomicrobiales bacterium]
MEFDLIIRNGTVVDGSGAARKRADVGITGDRIVAIDDLSAATAGESIDATDRIVSPGFIDVHIHSEVNLLDPSNPRRHGALLQGVTTHLAGPDGFGWARLKPDLARDLYQAEIFAYGEVPLDFDWPTANDYLSLFPGNSPANVMPQIPHCAIRLEVMGWEHRHATDAEIEQMKVGVRDWLDAGASCLCLGLDYAPSASSDTRELIELSKLVAEYGGIYATHQRYNDLGGEAAWLETIEIGRKAGIPVHVSHAGVDEMTGRIMRELDDAVDLTFESYLYPAGCTDLTLMLPIWASAGGPESILERANQPELRAQMVDHLQDKLKTNKGTARIVFADNPGKRYIGEEIGDVAERLGLEPGEFAMRMIVDESPYCLMVYLRGWDDATTEKMIRETVQHPLMMVASDGIYHGASSHPRGAGCFARVLRLAVREMQAVTLEEAVRKMTSFPAERFRIGDRGLLRAGYGADVVIFDEATVADRSTWTEPFLEPVGIDRVIVNGRTVILDGTPTSETPGQIVRRA